MSGGEGMVYTEIRKKPEKKGIFSRAPVQHPLMKKRFVKN